MNFTPNLNLYKWDKTDAKVDTITEMSKNVDKIEQQFTAVDITIDSKADAMALLGKTDIEGDHKGTWQGLTPSQVDVAVSSKVDSLESQLAQTMSKTNAFINSGVEPLFSKIAEIKPINTNTFLQGGCSTDKYLVLALVSSDNTSQTLYILDKITYVTLNTITTNVLGHANSMCFNPINKKIYIAEAGTNNLYVINESDLLASSLAPQTIVFSEVVNSIACDDKHFYLFNNSTAFKTDHVLQVIDRVEIDFTGLGLQNAMSYEGTIILNVVDLQPSSQGFGKQYVFDSHFTLIKVINVGLKMYELQNTLYNGDKFISTFYNPVAGLTELYIQDFNNKVGINETNYDHMVGSDYKYPTSPTFYFDKNYTGNVCDGTSTKPFKSLFTLFQYVDSLNISGSITIHIQSDVNEVINVRANNNLVINGNNHVSNSQFNVQTDKFVTLNNFTVTTATVSNGNTYLNNCTIGTLNCYFGKTRLNACTITNGYFSYSTVHFQGGSITTKSFSFCDVFSNVAISFSGLTSNDTNFNCVISMSDTDNIKDIRERGVYNTTANTLGKPSDIVNSGIITVTFSTSSYITLIWTSNNDQLTQKKAHIINGVLSAWV